MFSRSSILSILFSVVSSACRQVFLRFKNILFQDKRVSNVRWWSTSRLPYDEVRDRVEGRGHILVSKEYKNKRKPLEVICVCGKPWSSSLGDIERGSTCHGRPPKIEIEDAMKLAIERGGECISTQIENSKKPLNWRCSNNHKFSKSYDEVRGSKGRVGVWCPYCSSSRYVIENICRLLLEKMFDRSFKKAWPVWLRTRKGSQLELDGYCPEVNIAFEYQGDYHYPEAHSRRKGFSKKTYLRQIACDRLTKYACMKNGVKLVVIELQQKGQCIEDLVQKIEDQLEFLGINGYTKIDLSNISINAAYKSSDLDELVEFCKRHNGILKVNVFMGLSKLHVFVCDKGHEFKCTPQLMYLYREGRFCLTCEKEERDREVTDECERKGFDVLSIPEKITDKMSVRCRKCRDIQEIVFYNIKNSKTDTPCGKSCKSQKIAEGVRKYNNDDLAIWAVNCDYVLLDKEFTSLEDYYSVRCKHCKITKAVVGASLKDGKKCICQRGERISQAKLKYDVPFYKVGLKTASAELISVDYDKDRVAYKCDLCWEQYDKDRHYVAKGGTVCNRCKTKIAC